MTSTTYRYERLETLSIWLGVLAMVGAVGVML